MTITEDPKKPSREARSVENSPRPRPLPPSTPIAALRMQSLLLWVIQRVDSFPRNHKFSVGSRWIDACLDIQTSLVEATYLRDKRQLLSQASRGLVRARVLAELAKSLHGISIAQELHFAKESSEIGKMIGGWLRSFSRPSAQANSQEFAP